MSTKIEKDDDKTGAVTAKADTAIDLQRRWLLGGLGVLSTALTACYTEQRPSKDVASKDIGNNGRRLGDNQNVDCGCMPPGATPPAGTVPGTPVGTTPGTPTTGALPSNPTPLATAFTSVGPDAVTLTVSDMMTTTTLSDGRVINAWSFSAGGSGFNSDRLSPGPVVECLENTPMNLTLSTMMAHTIHLHGLDVDTINDGVPSTSFYVVGGMGGVMPAPMIPPAIAGYPSQASPHTYMFTPRFAGTYMYHCHVDTVLHMEMGMWGTIIVRPADGNRNTVWTGGPQFDKEYIWHLHTYDSSWHTQTQSSPVTARYNPDYFMINGFDGGNLLLDVATAVQATAGQRILIRLVNPGYLPARVSLGGLMFQVVSSDGRPLLATLNTSQLLIGPGERYDIIFNMPAIQTQASVNYLHATGKTVLGTAITTITPQ